jgi:MFS family permease
MNDIPPDPTVLATSRGKGAKRSVANVLSRVFRKDVHVSRARALHVAGRSIILTALGFMFVHVTGGEFSPTGMGQALWWVYLVVIFIPVPSLVLGGMIYDRLIKHNGLFEILALVATALVLSLAFINIPIYLVIVTISLAIVLGMLAIAFVTGMLALTSLLNRARVLTLLIVITTAMAVPVTSLLYFIPSLVQWAWIPAAIIAATSLAITAKKPRPFIPCIPSRNMEEGQEQPNLRVFFGILKKTRTFRTGLFLFFAALTLGFYFNSVFKPNTAQSLFDPTGAIIALLAAAVSLLIFPVVLDHAGRKPIAYVVFFLLGAFSIFFDNPGKSSIVVDAIRACIYTAAVTLIALLALVLAGDLSGTYSTGRITSVLLLSTIVGATIGYVARDLLIGTNIVYSGFDYLLIFAIILFFIPVKESLQPSTRNWHDFLLKIYIISNNGLLLISRDFKEDHEKNGGNRADDDLAGGGLFGIQSMLQEIAKSKDRIRFLDHGDVIFIFHYGKDSTAVLLVEKNLDVFYEKLANLHERFEFLNRDLIQRNSIKVKDLREVDMLLDQYFT